jgi:hypothetical protein
MKEENLIHIKFEYDEALKAKKDLLSSEIILLRISRTIKSFKQYRIEELKLKLKISKLLKDLKVDLLKLQKVLPKIKIPNILKENQETNKEEKQGPVEKRVIQTAYDATLEAQLADIQEKLNALANS